MMVQTMEKKLVFENAYQEAFDFCMKVRDKLNSSDYYLIFLQHLHHCSIGKIGMIELKEIVGREIAQFPDLVNMFDHLLEHFGDTGRFLAQEETGKGKPIQYSELSKCSPKGYRVFPMDYRTAQPNQRSVIGAQVLRDGLAASVSTEQKMKVMEQKKLAIKRVYQEAFGFCMQVRDKLSSSDDYFTFLKHLHNCSIGKTDIIELKEMVGKEIAKFPDLMNQFNYVLAHYGGMGRFIAQEETDKLSSGNEKEEKENEHDKKRRKEEERSIQDSEVSQCQFITPSYRLAPTDCSMDKTSETSDICGQLLNDELICVYPGDSCFKRSKKNKYEKVLFNREDDQYEVDMRLNSFKSAKECVEGLLKEIKENKISSETPFHVFDHLSILNKRCIEKLCYEQGHIGDHLLSKLRKEPLVALPIILNCLKQKVEEVTKLKSKSRKKWAEVYCKNHMKSLGRAIY